MAKDIEGLTNATGGAPERVAVCTRESNVTRSAWRMEVSCDSGSGTITQLDDGVFRGEGIFLGWAQERLSSVYFALSPGEQPAFETLQLG